MASEKRLIDANALKEQIIKEIHFYWNNGDGGYYLAEDVIPDIEDAPTVDAVEVVRCKDCRWARPQDHREPTDTPKQMIICQCFMNHHIPAPWGARLAVNPEHFCSYGERRD